MEHIDEIYFESLIVDASRTLTDYQRKRLALLSFFSFDIAPKAMRIIVHSCEQSLTTDTIKNEYKEYLKRENHMDNTKKTKLEKKRKKFYKNLNYTQREMLCNLEYGFVNCDITLLYKLIKEYDLVILPPLDRIKPRDILSTKGDIVESLRLLRNVFVHRPHAIISTKETLCFADNMFNILRAISKLVKKDQELLLECRKHIKWSLSNVH